MDNDRKKALKAQFKHQEQERLRATIPMGLEDLKALLSYLDQRALHPCDHTLKQTTLFLQGRSLDPAKIIPWLYENDGGCDCEVIANVYDAVSDKEACTG